MEETFDLIVVGGGASGFMSAITAAEERTSSIAILEETSKTLEKVRISGGGRCNVTNACWDTRELTSNYPRGKKALLGAFSRFSTGDAINWFEERGLELKVEEDGRIFPKSNSSKEVIKCLQKASIALGVQCLTGVKVKTINKLSDKTFQLECQNKKFFFAKRVLIATGGSPSGKRIAHNLGHQLINAVPSLFTFKLNAKWLTSCSGISVDRVNLRLISNDNQFEQFGRVLITHWGLSGPAVLKLSSFAARDLNLDKYKSSLCINWIDKDYNEINKLLEFYRSRYSSDSLKKYYPFDQLPRRLWVAFLENLDIDPNLKWSNFSNLKKDLLCKYLTKNNQLIIGKGPFGEEFVTAGGINLKEIDLKSMESLVCKGLYFSGEVLNIDGVTGGFNFQHCWTSGWIAGRAIASSKKEFNNSKIKE